MNRNIKLTVGLCLLFVVLVLVLTYFRISRNSQGAAQAGSMSPEQLREVGALVYDKPVPLSAFTLQDHDGQPFTLDSLRGKWSLLFFGFTSCPDICPLTLNELAKFYRSAAVEPFRSDTDIIMVSVDPLRDTQEKMAAYVTGFDPDFTGVRGDHAAISALAKELYVAHSSPPAAGASHDYLIDHSGNILVINPQGDYHGFLESSIKADNIGQAYREIRARYQD
ncbi:MAG: SCO family protein [Pseudomonadales bacterium]|nr:SCO family protein [Pseudomonadales bacterium]